MITLVLGMHRSGTSYVARVLHESGVHLGDDLIAATGSNLLGHWESPEAVRINDRILEHSGASWYRPPGQVSCDPATTQQMRDFLARLTSKTPAGFKDPRTTVTFPAWKPLLGARIVIACFRHPLSVARSLSVRNGWPLEKGLALWLQYNRCLLDWAEGEKNLLWFDYDAPAGARAAVLRQALEASGARAGKDFDGLFNPFLKNHACSGPSGDETVDSLYAQLLKKSGGRSAATANDAVAKKIGVNEWASVAEAIRALSESRQRSERSEEEAARRLHEILAAQELYWNHLNAYGTALQGLQGEAREIWARLNGLDGGQQQQQSEFRQMWARLNSLEAGLSARQAEITARLNAFDIDAHKQRAEAKEMWARLNGLDAEHHKRKAETKDVWERIHALEAELQSRLSDLESTLTFLNKSHKTFLQNVSARISDLDTRQQISSKALWERINGLDEKASLQIERLKQDQARLRSDLEVVAIFVARVRNLLPLRVRRFLKDGWRPKNASSVFPPPRPTSSSNGTIIAPAARSAAVFADNAPGLRDRNPEAKAIAFYLPQFHPIPENDAWWGAGFTEWSNVAKAKPNFKEHYQPHLPSEMGFYDLRVPEIQKRQIELAKKYGVYGFCFYYYWFNGRRLLERPLNQFLADRETDFPFCLCWANENWTRRWDGGDRDVLIQQTYTRESYLQFIKDLIPALQDRRYIRFDGKPLLIVYRLNLLPNPREAANLWREECRKQGVGEIYLTAAQSFGITDPRPYGFDAALEFPPHHSGVHEVEWKSLEMANPRFRGRIYDYRSIAEGMLGKRKPEYPLFKGVMTAWDNTPRMQDAAHIFLHSTPENYGQWLRGAVEQTKRNFPEDGRFVFINAWNEWGEGAHLEPDRAYQYAYLQATADAVAPAEQTRPRSPVRAPLSGAR